MTELRNDRGEPIFSCKVGVDIGGTFTDVVFLTEDGRLHAKKVPSSVSNYSDAIVSGIADGLREIGQTNEAIMEIRHGTTVGSNAILERRGAKVGLIGTKGFRDILDIRTLRMPKLYDLRWEKPIPLVERYLRLTVDERVNAKGHVERPLDPADAKKVVERLLSEGVEAISICLLNSFINPVHEQQIKDIALSLKPDLTICTSFEVLPEIKEYERTSTTVINAFLKPVIERYLKTLRSHLDNSHVESPLLLMQSNGGLTTFEMASELPIHIVESGPAGGVIGAQAIAEGKGLNDVITFDMGGTTAKASLIENGLVSRVHECQIGGGVIVGSRLLTGAGYTIKVPAIDLAEVGAGGGSIIAVDAGGSMRVGPRSAGAEPGPVCYDLGGGEPTITDASVILGYINPEFLVGGAVPLNASKAASVLRERIAEPLGLSTAQAALGAHQIAVANMIRAIRSVSTERGRDPRRFTLFAFGGNGPLFAAGVAEALGVKRIIVPPAPGVFSSLGFLCANIEHHYSRTFRCLLRDADLDSLNGTVNAMSEQAIAQLTHEGFTGESAVVQRHASLHYQGQTYELTIRMPDGVITRELLAQTEEMFGQEHEATYGHRAGPEEPVEMMTMHIIGHGLADGKRVPDRFHLSQSDLPPANPRKAFFGEPEGWLETPVLRRSELSEKPISGPFIIEEYDATCLVPPKAQAKLDAWSNIVIEL